MNFLKDIGDTIGLDSSRVNVPPPKAVAPAPREPLLLTLPVLLLLRDSTPHAPLPHAAAFVSCAAP